MQSRASHKRHATRTVNPLDGPIGDWREGDEFEENDLAYAFYVLLDDNALEDVFDDFVTPVA
jgi:hypothetical protein